MDGDDGEPGYPGRRGEKGKKGERGEATCYVTEQGRRVPKPCDLAMLDADQSRGKKEQNVAVSYVRWGRSTCPSRVERIYRGLYGNEFSDTFFTVSRRHIRYINRRHIRFIRLQMTGQTKLLRYDNKKNENFSFHLNKLSNAKFFLLRNISLVNNVKRKSNLIAQE